MSSMNSEFRNSLSGSSGRVLVCSADPQVWRATSQSVSNFGFDSQVIGTLDGAVELLSDELFDACLLDAREFQSKSAGATRQNWTVKDICTFLWSKNLTTRPVLLVDGRSVSPSGDPIDDESTCASQMFDMVQRPYTTATLGSALFSAVQHSRLTSENRRLKSQVGDRTLRQILGQSTDIQRLCEHTQQAADTDRNVLIHGEPGTGTNLVARAIHDGSRRAHRPFIKFHCRNLSAAGFECELFGSQVNRSDDVIPQPGRLALAIGGTLFLDDVDAIPVSIQIRLYRALDKQAGRIPGHGDLDRQDVRVVAATHVDLDQRVRQKQFHTDLYSLQNGFTIRIPPLRQHPADVSMLAEHFLAEQAANEGTPSKRITLEALQLLKTHDWPGNVRELRNVIERASSLDCGPDLTAEIIRPWLVNDAPCENETPMGLTLREMERKLIETTFTRYAGNRERTAKSLNIGLRTLSGKLREYGYPPRGGPGSNRKAA